MKQRKLKSKTERREGAIATVLADETFPLADGRHSCALQKNTIYSRQKFNNIAATHLLNSRAEQSELRLSTTVRKGRSTNSTLVRRLQ